MYREYLLMVSDLCSYRGVDKRLHVYLGCGPTREEQRQDEKQREIPSAG